MKFLLCCPSSLPLRHAEERVSSVAGFYTRHIRAIATSVLSSDAPLIFLLLHCTNLQPLSPLSVCMSICLQSRPRCAHAVEFNGGSNSNKTTTTKDRAMMMQRSCACVCYLAGCCAAALSRPAYIPFASCCGTSLYYRPSAVTRLSLSTRVATMQRDLHCAVRTFARHKSMTGVSHRRNVAYVSTWPEEINETSGSHDENETGSQTGTICEGHAEGSSVADAAEPSVVDFTKDVELEKLERSYRRSDKGARFLSPQERRMFTKMIYNQFYKDEGTTLMDPAMMYQASLEIQWVEEWVASTARAKHLSIDDARREVKKSLLERVDLHKPLSYIIGSQPFFGCDIHCEAPLLCPRPETEMWTHWLVYNCLNRVREAAASGQEKDGMGGPQLKVLDMCCGTGCIGVALAKHVPSAVVTAVDILPEAVTVSKLNAQHNGIPDARYTALRSDMFECFMEPRVALSSLATAAKEGLHNDAVCSEGGEAEERPLGTILPEYVGVFDVIVSNPPYVLPNQYVDLPRTITHWESKIALVGDDYRESRQYLYFKELCVHGAKLLKPRHMRPAALRDTPNLVIEVGLQAHMVADLMEQSKLWRDVSIHLDYAQQERWVSAVSTHRRSGEILI